MAYQAVFIGSSIALPQRCEDRLLVEEFVRGFKIKVTHILDVRGIFRSPAILR